MKIAKLIIKNFRSIKKTTIELNDINAIVGQNNHGKSNLLKALNAFFNFEQEEQFFIDKSHLYSPNAIPKIELHFIDFDSSKIAKKYLNKDKLIIQVSFENKGNSCKQKIEYKVKNKDNKLTWYADKEKEVLNLIKEQIDFIIIPTSRAANILEQEEANILQTILESMMEQKTKSRDNYTVKFKEAIKNLHKALKEISSLLTKELPIDIPVKIIFDYVKDISYKNFLSFMSISIKEAGQSHKLIECGSGIQSSVIMSLYNMLAKIQEKSIIIALEEPETHLHSHAQIELIVSYKKMLKNRDISQLLFTAHSANMIDQLDHTDIILCNKEYLEATKFNSIFIKISPDFFMKNNLDKFKYDQFHQYKNSDFFLANHVVITESKNEIEIIKNICKSEYHYGSFNYQCNGISYLSLDGILNIGHVICLLRELDKSFTLIVDKDFLVSYCKDSYKESVDKTTGFPSYKAEYKNSSQPAIKLLIKESKIRNEILSLINKGNHKKLSDLLEPHNIICMKYNLELDLISSTKAQEEFHKLLKTKNNSITELTINKKRAIKNIENMLSVFQSLPAENWPESYKRIKKVLSNIIKKSNKNKT